MAINKRCKNGSTGELEGGAPGDETSAQGHHQDPPPAVVAPAPGPPNGPVKNESPIPHPNWPKQSEVRGYFGKHEMGHDGRPTARWESNNLTSIALPYPMRLAWDTDTQVRRMTCHRGVQHDLCAILDEIKRHYGGDPAQLRAARLDLFGGCYNYRPMRDGTSLSMHSWGIAIDLDPNRNARLKPWKKDSGMMPEAVVDIFLSHGWTWGGLWKTNPDPMHFQATQPL